MDLSIELPYHIAKLEEEYKRACEDIANAPYRSKKYYNQIKVANDIKKQIKTNQDMANLIGVKYGVSAKPMGSSIKSYR